MFELIIIISLLLLVFLGFQLENDNLFSGCDTKDYDVQELFIETIIIEGVK